MTALVLELVEGETLAAALGAAVGDAGTGPGACRRHWPSRASWSTRSTRRTNGASFTAI